MYAIKSVFIVLILAFLLYAGGCNYNKVEDIRINAPAFLDKQGFVIVGQEGFQIGDFAGSPGGKVWYILKRKDDPHTVYNCYVSMWHTGEYQIYNLRAVNALSSR